MAPSTDQIRLAARLDRKPQADTARSAEFYQASAKAMDEIPTGLESVSKRD